MNWTNTPSGYTVIAGGQRVRLETIANWNLAASKRRTELQLNPPKPLRIRNRPRPNSRKKRKARNWQKFLDWCQENGMTPVGKWNFKVIKELQARAPQENQRDN